MRVLIIGKNSYIGNHVDEWLTTKGFKVVQLDVLNSGWQTYDYSNFDVIVHVAGIVHRPDCKDWNLYKSVNTDMPISIATRAKEQGVKSYIYFSTMGVYGKEKKLSPTVIDKATPLKAGSMYGKSKLMAEVGLAKLQDVNFNVAFIRPPSVYGKGCKGGYIKGFYSFVRYIPIIPRTYLNVRQSFIYIDNLCECVRLIIENQLNGVFCPQDDDIPNANEVFKSIAMGVGKKYLDSRFLGVLLRMVSFIPLVKKVYGGIEYSRDLSKIDGYNYVVVPFVEGMRRTVAEIK